MSSKDSFDLSQTSELIPNTWHSDKFDLVMSNFPSQKDFKDLRYFHNYIKTITIPELSLDMINSNFQGSMIRHPDAPKMNAGLSQIMCTFRLSEDFKNWLLLIDYIRSIRYGDLESDSSELISKYYINNLDLNLLDNHKRLVATLSFKKCFPTLVSSINLEFGTSEEILFSVNFSYSEMTYITQTING